MRLTGGIVHAVTSGQPTEFTPQIMSRSRSGNSTSGSHWISSDLSSYRAATHPQQRHRHALQLVLQRLDVRRLLLNDLGLLRQLEARGRDLGQLGR
jgi:hypothetical protein